LSILVDPAARPAMVNAGMLKAIEYSLELVCEPDYAEDLGLKYLSGNPKDRKEVLSVLAEAGITMTEIQAKAAELEGSGLQLFERLVSSRESARRMLRKEAGRLNRQDNEK
jgi:hypothetical protein